MTTPIQYGRLTPEESEMLVRTGPGTPMGELFRRFWLPALLSEELPYPDCPPTRVKLLGEELVAFRDTNGSVGLLDRYCPHRGTDLFYGRAEGGLRCIYHGWKFDVNGKCVEMPTEPPESAIKDKIHTKAYPTREYAGCIWAYLGPQEDQPELPALEWAVIPDSHRYISKRLQQCNWLQALEVDIDTAHIHYLHGRIDPSQPWVDTAPRFEVKNVGSGLLIAGRRDTTETNKYSWRVNCVFMPCYTLPPGNGHAWVPIDDESHWNFSVMWRARGPLTAADLANIHSPRSNYSETLPGTYRNVANRGNDFLIDREIQRTQRYTGLINNGLEDGIAFESMGPIVDHSREHLGIADTGVIEFRRLMLKAASDLQRGIKPEAAFRGDLYRYRSLVTVLDRKLDFFEAAKEELVSQA